MRKALKHENDERPDLLVRAFVVGLAPRF